MPTLYFVLWLMTIVNGNVTWERFDFEFEHRTQCQAAAELMPGVSGTACLTDQEDAILRTGRAIRSPERVLP